MKASSTERYFGETSVLKLLCPKLGRAGKKAYISGALGRAGMKARRPKEL